MYKQQNLTQNITSKASHPKSILGVCKRLFTNKCNLLVLVIFDNMAPVTRNNDGLIFKFSGSVKALNRNYDIMHFKYAMKTNNVLVLWPISLQLHGPLETS